MTSTQAKVDEAVGHFVEQAADWKSLAAMSAGSFFFRLGRMGTLALGSRAGAVLSPVVQGTSYVFGLGSEVVAFEGTSRALAYATGDRSNPHLFDWKGQGGLWEGFQNSFVNFGTLKIFGHLGHGQNFVVSNLMSDLGMVGGHELAHRLGLAPAQEGTFFEKMAHAHLTNLQMAAGMGLMGEMIPQIHGVERALDLQLRMQAERISILNRSSEKADRITAEATDLSPLAAEGGRLHAVGAPAFFLGMDLFTQGHPTVTGALLSLAAAIGAFAMAFHRSGGKAPQGLMEKVRLGDSKAIRKMAEKALESDVETLHAFGDLLVEDVAIWEKLERSFKKMNRPFADEAKLLEGVKNDTRAIMVLFGLRGVGVLGLDEILRKLDPSDLVRRIKSEPNADLDYLFYILHSLAWLDNPEAGRALVELVFSGNNDAVNLFAPELRKNQKVNQFLEGLPASSLAKIAVDGDGSSRFHISGQFLGWLMGQGEKRNSKAFEVMEILVDELGLRAPKDPEYLRELMRLANPYRRGPREGVESWETEFCDVASREREEEGLPLTWPALFLEQKARAKLKGLSVDSLAAKAEGDESIPFLLQKLSEYQKRDSASLSPMGKMGPPEGESDAASANDNDKLYAVAAPAWLGVDFLLNGHPTTAGLLTAGLMTLGTVLARGEKRSALRQVAQEVFLRFLYGWVVLSGKAHQAFQQWREDRETAEDYGRLRGGLKPASQGWAKAQFEAAEARGVSAEVWLTRVLKTTAPEAVEAALDLFIPDSSILPLERLRQRARWVIENRIQGGAGLVEALFDLNEGKNNISGRLALLEAKEEENFLRQPSIEDQLERAEGLLRLNRPEKALPFVRRVARIFDFSLCVEANRILREFGEAEEAATNLLQVLRARGRHSEAAAILLMENEQAREEAAAFLLEKREGEEEISLAAAQALGRHGKAEAVPLLLAFLRRQRGELAKWDPASGSPPAAKSAFPALSRILDDYLHARSAEDFGGIVEALLPHLGEASVRLELAASFRTLPEGSPAWLKAGLALSQEGVGDARESLERWAIVHLKQPSREILEDDSSDFVLRGRTVFSLVPNPRKRKRSPTPFEVSQAAQLASRLRIREAVPALENLAGQADIPAGVMLQVCEALIALDRPETAQSLLRGRLLKDPETAMRAAQLLDGLQSGWDRFMDPNTRFQLPEGGYRRSSLRSLGDFEATDGKPLRLYPVGYEPGHAAEDGKGGYYQVMALGSEGTSDVKKLAGVIPLGKESKTTKVLIRFMPEDAEKSAVEAWFPVEQAVKMGLLLHEGGNLHLNPDLSRVFVEDLPDLSGLPPPEDLRKRRAYSLGEGSLHGHGLTLLDAMAKAMRKKEPPHVLWEKIEAETKDLPVGHAKVEGMTQVLVGPAPNVLQTPEVKKKYMGLLELLSWKWSPDSSRTLLGLQFFRRHFMAQEWTMTRFQKGNLFDKDPSLLKPEEIAYRAYREWMTEIAFPPPPAIKAELADLLSLLPGIERMGAREKVVFDLLDAIFGTWREKDLIEVEDPLYVEYSARLMELRLHHPNSEVRAEAAYGFEAAVGGVSQYKGRQERFLKAVRQTYSEFKKLHSSQPRVHAPGEAEKVLAALLEEQAIEEMSPEEGAVPAGRQVNTPEGGGGKLYSFAAPALLGLDVLVNGHSTLGGMAVAFLSTLATAAFVMGAFGGKGGKDSEEEKFKAFRFQLEDLFGKKQKGDAEAGKRIRRLDIDLLEKLAAQDHWESIECLEKLDEGGHPEAFDVLAESVSGYALEQVHLAAQGDPKASGKVRRMGLKRIVSAASFSNDPDHEESLVALLRLAKMGHSAALPSLREIFEQRPVSAVSLLSFLEDPNPEVVALVKERVRDFSLSSLRDPLENPRDPLHEDCLRVLSLLLRESPSAPFSEDDPLHTFATRFFLEGAIQDPDQAFSLLEDPRIKARLEKWAKQGDKVAVALWAEAGRRSSPDFEARMKEAGMEAPSLREASGALLERIAKDTTDPHRSDTFAVSFERDGEYVFGRGAYRENFIPLPDRRVSRTHVAVVKRGDDFFIRDVRDGKTSYPFYGTWREVGDRIWERLIPGQTYPLKKGDRIALGCLDEHNGFQEAVVMELTEEGRLVTQEILADQAASQTLLDEAPVTVRKPEGEAGKKVDPAVLSILALGAGLASLLSPSEALAMTALNDASSRGGIVGFLFSLGFGISLWAMAASKDDQEPVTQRSPSDTPPPEAETKPDGEKKPISLPDSAPGVFVGDHISVSGTLRLKSSGEKPRSPVEVVAKKFPEPKPSFQIIPPPKASPPPPSSQGGAKP